MEICGAAQPAAKAKAKVKKCSKPSCWNNAASPRAKFCIGCFKDNARCTGARSTAAKAKAMVKKCIKPRCWNNAVSPRAKFCIGCFKDNARCTGARTGGNSGAKGVIGNSGNSSAKGVIGNRGNSSAKGVKGNSGNSSAKGLMGNRGNTNSGKKKKFAGKRGALLRSTKTLLLVMKPWVEIRGVCTKLRGKIHRTIAFRFKS